MIAWLPFLLLAFWPIPRYAGITGTFMEYRNHHLHAGFDLSTQGRIGLPVRCFDDGEIVLIKVQKRGYGRVLYIRHPKRKLVSVYAHLDRFLPAAEQLVARVRKRRMTRYPGTIRPKRPIHVKRGEIIAWSGETGVGWPHLHFELRNDHNEPVNPAAYGFQVKQDLVPPVFLRLHLYPESTTSRIDGACRPVHLPVESAGPRRYTCVPGTVTISGPVRMSVSLADSDGRKGALAVRTLTATLNGEPWYRFTADRFSFDHFNQSAAIFDLGHTRLSPTRYAYNLFRIPGANLDAQQQETRSFRPGPNTVEIHAEDFSGNGADLRFRILWTPATTPAKTFGFVGNQLETQANGNAIPKSITIEGKKWNVHHYGPDPVSIRVATVTLTVTGFNKHPRLIYVRTSPFPSPADKLLPVEGTAFTLAPGLLFLSDLALCGPAGPPDPAAGWYRYDESRKEWKYLDSTWEAEKNSSDTTGNWLAHDFRPGTYGMLLDHAPPVIAGNPWYFRNRTVWKIRDRGKGVDDTRIILRKENQTWQMDYDPDRQWAWIEQQLPPGRYQLTVADLAGNRASARGVLKRKRP